MKLYLYSYDILLHYTIIAWGKKINLLNL